MDNKMIVGKVDTNQRLSFDELTALRAYVKTPEFNSLPEATQLKCFKLAATASTSRKSEAENGLLIGQKGKLSKYFSGGRFPTTLSKAQWLDILANAEQIKTFISNHPELK